MTEYDEWGNPEADPDVYDYIASYAPYDNVTATTYPPILAETSLNDTRVLYVEPAKWVAKLRAVRRNGADVLLRTEMSAGHGGVSGRYKSWHDRAFALAWILDRMGLGSGGPGPIQRRRGNELLTAPVPGAGPGSPEKSLRVLSRCNYAGSSHVCQYEGSTLPRES